MAGSAPLSYPTAYAYAYAYTGRNAYAYSGNNAYAYSAPEAYGFDAGNPMLAGALEEVRVNVIQAGGYPSSIGAHSDEMGPQRMSIGLQADRLPAAEDRTGLNRCGAQPRMSVVQMELMSGLSFGCTQQGVATLKARDDGNILQDLLKVTRPTRDQFLEQLVDIDARIGDRDSRIREIVTQVAPPIAYFASVVNLQFGRHRRTVEFIDMALQFAYAVGQRFKLALACPRPSEYSAVLMPVIEVPQHASLPAGHAIESLVTAMLLSELVPGAKGGFAEKYMRALAWRIAENRVVAGVHFPVDCAVGQRMGEVLANYVLARAGQLAQVTSDTFDPTNEASLRFDSPPHLVGSANVNSGQAGFKVPKCELLAEQYECARAEWI